MFEDIFKKFQNFILLIFHTVVSFFKKSKKEGFNILEKFNYIQIIANNKNNKNEKTLLFLRGFKSCKYHSDILEKFNIIEKCKRLFISERAEHSMKRRLFH